MDQLGYFECEYACEQLPGFCTFRPKDLVPVFSELNTGLCTNVWVSSEGINTIILAQKMASVSAFTLEVK